MKVYDFAFDDEPTEVGESEEDGEDEFAPQECSICGRLIRKHCPQDGWIENFTHNQSISECIKCEDEREDKT